MRKITFGLACLVLVSCFCFADDQQFWGVTSFSFRLNDEWTMKIKENFRFEDGQHFEQINEIVFTTALSESLEMGLGFRQVHKEDAGHEWRRENRPYVELTVKLDLWGLKCSDRNRFVFRDFERKKDIFRYRNRFKVQWPEDIFDLPLRPYIAEEVFIEEEYGYDQNRIYAGVVWDVNKLLDVDIFVVHRSDKAAGGWDDTFITGIETIFSF